MRRLLLTVAFLTAFAVSVSAMSFYAIKRTDITTSSTAISFYPTNASTIMVYADSGNTADVCIDWAGGTAACPAADTAGNQRLAAGQSFTLDMRGARLNKISAIAESGTQTFSVLAIK